MGGQYTAKVGIVPWQSSIGTWLGGILSGIMEARNAKCFDHNSGATVGLSTGTLGIVEVIAVYFEVIFVGEVGFRYEHYVDLLLF